MSRIQCPITDHGNLVLRMEPNGEYLVGHHRRGSPFVRGNAGVQGSEGWPEQGLSYLRSLHALYLGVSRMVLRGSGGGSRLIYDPPLPTQGE
jgi:hypothetical protein